MNQQLGHLDKREKEVLCLWRSGDISLGSARTYLDWVRRFYAYCERLGLDEVAELSLEGALRFARSYMGPRTKGPVGASSCLIARNALHAWAYAIRALGTALPEWSPKRAQAPVSPLLKEYCEFHAIAASQREPFAETWMMCAFFCRCFGRVASL